MVVNKKSWFKRALYIFSGVISMLLAYAGIIIPGFPAIPFIILAAYFFANSSPRIFRWLIRQKLMRKLIRKGRKIDRRVLKGLLISQVWFSVVVGGLAFAHTTLSRILFGAGGVVLTVLILIFMKTHRNEVKAIEEDPLH